MYNALIALTLAAFTSTTTLDGCVESGHTGEGFPAYSCDDGRTLYADMDGDGRDASTIGRLIETNPEWIVQ